MYNQEVISLSTGKNIPWLFIVHSTPVFKCLIYNLRVAEFTSYVNGVGGNTDPFSHFISNPFIPRSDLFMQDGKSITKLEVM